MKISTYHKLKKDKVEFFKGDLRDLSLRLKLEYTLKELRKVDKRIGWNEHTDIIYAYLKTKHTKYIAELAEFTNNKRKEKIETALRKFSNQCPLDHWDRIYITTLFTFYWDITINTIHFCKQLVSDNKRIFIGGVMASLLKTEIFEETGIKPFAGLLDKPGALDPDCTQVIDELPLDYSILEEIDYKYPTQSAYFTFMTKGCTRKCAFCSVPKLEPTYKPKISSTSNFELVNKQFGMQRNLLLMDNNVLASPKFDEIISEIKSMGFVNGALYEEPNQLDICIKNLRAGYNDKAYIKKAYSLIRDLERRVDKNNREQYLEIIAEFQLSDPAKVTKSLILQSYKSLKEIYEKFRPKTHSIRYVDFNQGTDARYVTEENMRLMSEIPIKPLRIAFDHIGIKETYKRAVELAAKYGIKDLSNYILYNFHDKPEDFYERLKINVDLGKRLNIKIFSFPMKYIPLFGEEAKHRRHVGPHWNKKFIRAIQSILNATKGIVAPGYDFFNMAFGENLDEFLEILWMPESYIINRRYFQTNRMVDQWRTDLNSLNELERITALEIIKGSDFSNIQSRCANPRILRLLSHYQISKEDKKEILLNIRRLRSKYNRLIKKDMFVNLTLTHDFDLSKNSPLKISYV